MTGTWGAETARWGLGGAAVLALHIAAGYWLIEASRRGEVAGLPDAITVELLPEPAMPEAAPEADASEPAEPASEAAAADPAEPVDAAEPAPDFQPPDFQQLPPVTDFADLLPEPAAVADFEPPPLTELPPVTDFAELLPPSALLLSASERPVSRPERRKPAPEPEPQRQQTRREEPRQERQQPARQQPAREQPAQQRQPARQAGSEQRQPTRQAQPGGARQGTPTASPRQMESWKARVGGRIKAHMMRAAVSGTRVGEVTVQLQVSIAANGAASARVISSTGNARADAALARQAGRMPKMAAPPNGQPITFTAPLRINIR